MTLVDIKPFTNRPLSRTPVAELAQSPCLFDCCCGKHMNSINTQVKTPWFDILLSPAVWAIIIAHFCNNWGFYTLLTCMPTYLKQAVNLQQLKSAVSYDETVA